MALQKKLRSIGTHDGTFHADEVTACGLLLLFDLVDEDKIIRTRDPIALQQCEYVCDVGGEYDPSRKLFDHHQADYVGPLSSAGMVLKYLLEINKLNRQEYDFFNQSLVLGVDAHDNGADLQLPGVCTYSLVVANFTPIHHEASREALDQAFHEALEFSLGHLKRLWKRYHYVNSCRQIVIDSMSKNESYLFFDKGIPWIDSFFSLDGEHHPALFVVMPSGSHWKLRGIPPNSHERMKVRFPLPLAWAGLSNDELKNVTGIAGAIFCHKGRFISVWETKEDALKALELTLSLAKEEQ
ncbi:hypothetical protein PHSC3_001705 [Chlamydiales bacterium STE3]|nr:hypothetical protein PHSC3_001705 [Chlamydiales bacterium STE3]